MKPEDLVTYCGGYCGYCARWHEHAALVKLAAALAELADGHGFHYWMPQEIKSFSYEEFRRGLDFFSDENSWLVCRNSCRNGDGNPFCEVRKCCQEQSLDICFDCNEFPCGKVADNERALERAKEYKELSKEEWLRLQVEKARRGYEGHTRKCYQVVAEDDLQDK